MSSSGSGEDNWRKPKLKLSSRGVLSSDGDGDSRSPVTPKFPKVFHYGAVLTVNYARGFGFLSPLQDGDSPNVYFKVDEDPLAMSTPTLTGGIRLIPGDIMEYEVSRYSNYGNETAVRAHVARLRECKSRNAKELESYVDNLVAEAFERPETVLRVITKCSGAFKLVLDRRSPSDDLINDTLLLCKTLSRSRELYRSRLKQFYALFARSPFLTSRSWSQYLSSDQDDRRRALLQGFLVNLLEFSPAQLPSIAPLILKQIPQNRDATLATQATDVHQVLPLLHEDGKACLEKMLKVLILSDDGETFLRKVVSVLAGGNSANDQVPWSQLPLLPTHEEVRSLQREGATLPKVKEVGPYDSPEDYLDTYLQLLREDCLAGLLQGIRALRMGNADKCDMKLWTEVAVCGVYFNYSYFPGLTLAITLPKTKNSKKTPMDGSLVCFFEESGGFESPIWGVVSRCEDDNDSKIRTVCFVDIRALAIGPETSNIDASSWSVLYARLVQAKDLVMAESPTYYRAYQPVLETLQSTSPAKVPFQEELVSVAWPEDPTPDYLNSAASFDGSPVTLDWSCIFKHLSQIREGVDAIPSLLERGFQTSFDPSQLKAVELAVHNRVAMIQGPPGTGKTHVGVTLLQLLRSASTFPQDRPAVVITLKNHALDQILERCLKFESRIVRVGGRSKSPILEPYNLNRKITYEDEFWFDWTENRRKLEDFTVEVKNALDLVNKYLAGFDPNMILEQAPEFHMNVFLERAVHPRSKLENSARKVPESLTLVELLRGRQIPEDTDATLANDVLDFRSRLGGEVKRWMPTQKVLHSAIAFLSLTKPVSKSIPKREHAPAESLGVPDEEDEQRKEEAERRAAYESLRQEINLDAQTGVVDRSSKPSNQWLSSTSFVEFPKTGNGAQSASMPYRQLNLDAIAGQFDWIAQENPYDLSMEHRALLVYKYWQECVNGACERLERMKAEYDTLSQDQEQIGQRRKLADLRDAKIIGMTTTGAAIHRNVMKLLSPAVVLVEEAAEILEPQVLASLNSDLQHLILIGDHQQLRPQVESYELEIRHGFGVSMFERLVEHNKLPSQQLGMQCRMRDEFVAMLRPIYPNLTSQTELVSGSRNAAPTCMAKTMYFWSHSSPETNQRSFVNPDEARMVVALARWIASEIADKESLKILAAYNGQVTLIRSLKGNYSDLENVEVHSIDSFQGSEAEIVIVSLVRSNDEGKIGHLNIRNRLCVAASRARRGVYFVGNSITLSHKSPHWRLLTHHFEDLDSLSSAIPLCCPRHPDRPPFPLTTTAAVSQFEVRNVCGYPCQKVLGCGHNCGLTCHFGAHTEECKELVDFTFGICGHAGIRMCHQGVEDLHCKQRVIHEFPVCGHSREVECWLATGHRKGRLKCQVVCGKKLEKCGHLCRLFCSVACESAPCQDCLEVEKEKEKIRNQIRMEAIVSKRRELEGEIAKLKEKGSLGISVQEVHPHDDTALSFYSAKDRVEKYTQPDYKAMVVVTQVQKIDNLVLQKSFLEAQKDLFDPLEIAEWLFYGGSNDQLDQIANRGFRLTPGKAHRFEAYSSSVAQQNDNHNLLLCEVLLGKTLRLPYVEALGGNFDSNRLRKNSCDSVSLGGGRENADQFRPVAHAIFNPRQAIPRFLVSFKLVNLEAVAEDHEFERFGKQKALENGGVCRLPLLPSLHDEGLTPQDCHFRMAESQFYRMSQNRKLKVTKVEFVKNLPLEEKFKTKKEEFKALNVTVKQQFVFHGTGSAAIDKITTEGFKIGGEGVPIRSGAAYGRGVYTAANPDISLHYSGGYNMMLLSTAILGKLGKDHAIGGSNDVFVVKNASQLLPRYVVHYSN